VIDAGEECDGNNLNGQSCMTLGFEAGQLACGNDCQLDTDDCCAGLGGSCNVDGDCCGNVSCADQQPMGGGEVCCLPFGSQCSDDSECCSNSCNNGQDYCELNP
jgi:hypothetical protein